MIHRHTDRRHVSTSIEGLLSHYKRKKLNGIITDDDGRAMNGREAKTELRKLLASGHRLIKSSGCDNFCSQKGCLGHGSYTHLHDYEFEEGQG